METKWVQLNRKNVDYQQLSVYYQVHPAILKAITHRGVTNLEEYFGVGTLHNPALMKDMDKGTDIMADIIRRNEPVRIIADYDVDGVMSGYILKKGLTRCGAKADVVIPNRITDGYGINKNMIEEAYKQGIRNIITCDNGIAAIDAIYYGKSLGMTIVVTDHHEIPYKEENEIRTYLKSEADAIVNPHQKECNYPFKNLCGAAVAWKFLQCLYPKCNLAVEETDMFMENVAFATISDVMDLQGENRMIVKQGLYALNRTQNIGLRALINANGLTGKEIKAYHVGFILAPCINASGRLEIANHALDLMCEEDTKKAQEIAEKLLSLNMERKALTEQALKQAIEQANTMVDEKVLVIYLPDCHESIAGIVAGKVREYTNKPSFVLTKGEICVKGSGRSIEAYSMFEEMNKVKEYLLGFGGHPMAAGLSLKEENIEVFRKRINELSSLTKEDIVLKIKIDDVVSVFETSQKFLEQIARMEPFGKANTKPVFADRDLRIAKISLIGKNKTTCKVSLEKDGKSIEGMVFFEADKFLEYLKQKYSEKEVNKAIKGEYTSMILSITYDMSMNEFRGMVTPQVIINNYL